MKQFYLKNERTLLSVTLDEMVGMYGRLELVMFIIHQQDQEFVEKYMEAVLRVFVDNFDTFIESKHYGFVSMSLSLYILIANEASTEALIPHLPSILSHVTFLMNLSRSNQDADLGELPEMVIQTLG